MTKRLRLILVGLFFALIAVSYGVRTYFNIIDIFNLSTLGFTLQKNTTIIQIDETLDDNPAAAVLRSGDELVSFNGETYVKGQSQMSKFIQRARPGTTYTVGVRRDGQVQEFALRTAPIPLLRAGIWTILGYVMFAAYFLTGLIVFLLRPDDKQALLLALMLCVISGGGFSRSALDALPWLSVISIVLALSVRLVPAIFLHFFLVFPERSPLLRRFPRLEWAIYPLWLLTGFPYVAIMDVLRIIAPERVYETSEKLVALSWVSTIAVMVYGFGGLVSLVVNYRQANRQSRRKMRVVLVGTLVGLMPVILLSISTYFYPPAPTFGWMAISFLASALQLLVPLSFAYAIVRHQVIPVSLIVRRGVRYLLVSRGSVVLEAMVVFVALTFFLTAFFRYLRPSNGMVIGIISGVVAVAVSHVCSTLHRRFIAPAIDRRFFREAYDAQSLLAELSQAVRTVTGVSELLELVTLKLQQALHTQNVTVFLLDKKSENYVCATSSEYREDVHSSVTGRPDLALPRDGFVAKKLSQDMQSLTVDFSDPNSWLNEINAVYPVEATSHLRERETLQQIHSALLLPLATKDRLLGIISLGARLGDLPFSREDERLLQSVAAQTSFALENAQLVEQMLEEERRRQEIEAENEQRARELEEARQLQLSMLPREVPQLPDLEIAAYMKPAAEVGGDYYDFYVGEDGTLTIAVGDATGHGLKAGTMVTATKGLFNAFAHETEIPHIFQESSRALKRMNLRALYMAMTMVKIKDSHLVVSAAGMPPMLIHRAATGKVEEVAIKGMPLGSVANFPYQQQELGLQAGDTVMLMSDGFPERFNEKGEMLDYQHAKKLLEEVATNSSQEIINRFVQTGERWAGARPQDDDVTFVVLKVRNGNGASIKAQA